MIIKQEEMAREIRPKMRGGEGEIELIHIVSPDKLKNARLLSYINIPVNASIGRHEHVNETEYYIILEGNGKVLDDGVEKNISAGDVVVTGGGASHSIYNTGVVTLKMIAVIITY